MILELVLKDSGSKYIGIQQTNKNKNKNKDKIEKEKKKIDRKIEQEKCTYEYTSKHTGVICGHIDRSMHVVST